VFYVAIAGHHPHNYLPPHFGYEPVANAQNLSHPENRLLLNALAIVH
jgi:hypothetical protein